MIGRGRVRFTFRLCGRRLFVIGIVDAVVVHGVVRFMMLRAHYNEVVLYSKDDLRVRGQGNVKQDVWESGRCPVQLLLQEFQTLPQTSPTWINENAPKYSAEESFLHIGNNTQITAGQHSGPFSLLPKGPSSRSNQKTKEKRHTK